MRASIHASLCALSVAACAFALPVHATTPASDAAMVTCKDGSTAKAGQGACSHHGGMAPATAKCKDGSFWYNKEHSGACSDHGGVDQWLDEK